MTMKAEVELDQSASDDNYNATQTLLPTKNNDSYPLASYFILGQEVCERFSFYGLKAILAIYFTNHMLYSEDNATICVHAFIFFGYFGSVFGGWLSDKHLGRFRTVLYLSLIYIAGSALLSITALDGATGTDPPHWWGWTLSLFMVGIGTSGIKPCVSAFMGDQFVEGQEKQLESMFFWFYFSINIGSFMSYIITPLIEKNFSFSLAFGTAGVLLSLSLVVFYLGRPRYIMHPPSGVNVFSVVFDVVGTAWTERKKARQEGRKDFENFLDYAVETHGSTKVDDVRSLVDVLRVYITIPIFWSCFDQSSSRWVFQARRMDLFGGRVTESQIGAIQPLLVLALIPFFNKCVYPGLSMIGINLKPAGRIACGFVISGLSFAYAAVLERAINSQPDGSLSVGYQLPQYVILTCAEIMISITGLEFAYSQAPKSMKGVVSAMWLLTVAFGNVIVIVVAAINIGNQELEFWIYVGLSGLATVILLILTRGYVYKSFTGAAPRKASEVIYTEALEESFRQ